MMKGFGPLRVGEPGCRTCLTNAFRSPANSLHGQGLSRDTARPQLAELLRLCEWVYQSPSGVVGVGHFDMGSGSREAVDGVLAVLVFGVGVAVQDTLAI